jgi:phosphatidylinositol-4,5-bisphosphate 3-kinase catalytic subunit alpha/beta/delta
MVRNDGVFFHIDFGHFLGNWKYKLGVCRERTKFVFTPEMAHVMGKRKSPRFKHFEAICLEAITAARKHGRLLENLFALMVSAGMPELVIEEDIYYLRDRLDMGGKDATKVKERKKKER